MMLFGLKNIGATYQRAIHACFEKQLNKNIEAYVDDVVVKTRVGDSPEGPLKNRGNPA
jgi:hypothetical protein